MIVACHSRAGLVLADTSSGPCTSTEKERQLISTTKHELLDWLMDVPEDAEIGTDGAGLALLAILGTNVHLLEVGRIPYADELYA